VTVNIRPERDYSLVTVEHTNIPDDDFENISEGWNEYYMGAINALFNPDF
jgi:activator of HSP90 ATPase